MPNIDPTHPKFIDTDELRNDDTEGHVSMRNDGGEPDSIMARNNPDQFVARNHDELRNDSLRNDDTEGHVFFEKATEADDTKPDGFMAMATGDDSEGDDTEGHVRWAFSLTDDGAGSEPDQFAAMAVPAEEDDTEGHISLVSPGPDADGTPDSLHRL